MSLFKSAFSRVPKHSKFHYQPRYVKEKKGLEKRKREIKLEKGSFFKHSKTLSKFREPSISHYKHNSKSRKNAKYIVSIAMMGCIIGYYNFSDRYAGMIALAGLFILLIVFIRLNNKS